MNLFTEFLLETEAVGSFLGCRFNKETKDAIKKYCKEHDIKNPVSPSDLHCTLIFSAGKPLPKDFKPLGVYDEPMVGSTLNLDIWPSADGKNVLVLAFRCPQLTARHNELMSRHDLNWSHPAYQPHATLSYDIGDREITSFPNPLELIPLIVIDKEYQEPLKTT